MIDKNQALRTGELLRIVIRATGFRNYFDDNGWGQDLDDVANGNSSRSNHHDLTESLARKYLDEIGRQCCWVWTETAERQWETISGYLASSSKRFNKSVVPLDENDCTPLDFVIYKLLPDFIDTYSNSSFGLAKPNTWWKSPFKVLLDVTSGITNIPEKTLTERIMEYLTTESDRQDGKTLSQKTVRNWKSGKPITKIRWPHQELVEHVTGLTHNNTSDSFKIKNLTGLLIVAIGFQTIDNRTRQKMKNRDFPKREEDTARKYKDAELIYEKLQTRKETVHQLFYQERFSPSDVESELKVLQDFLESCPKNLSFIHDFYSARLAAFSGDKKTALVLYRTAQDGAMWVSGRDQEFILQEAFIYSFGIKHKPSIKRYWDRHFLLKIIHGDKREMSCKEAEKYSEAFHDCFPYQAAALIANGDIGAIHTELRLVIKDIELLFRDTPFSVNDLEQYLDWLENYLSIYLPELSFHHDRYSARLHAFRGSPTLALDSYRIAVEKSAQIEGEVHKDIVYESFVYSTGINDLASSEYYWKKYHKLHFDDDNPQLTEDDKPQILSAFRNMFPVLSDENDGSY